MEIINVDFMIIKCLDFEFNKMIILLVIFDKLQLMKMKEPTI
jgi:hypothetical protein